MKIATQAAVLLSTLVMLGCTTPSPPEVRIVEVPRPIPFCPAPPDVPYVPARGLLVDQLTEADETNPGKVAMAYKHDMLFYRNMSLVLADVLSQYSKTAMQWDYTQQRIDELYKKATEDRAKYGQSIINSPSNK